MRSHYSHATGKFTALQELEAKQFLIFEGLHSLYLRPMRNLLDLKIFMAPSEDLRIFWKIKRDMAKRGYTKEKVLEQIQHRKADSQQHISVQKEHADFIFEIFPVGGEHWTYDQILENEENLELSIRARVPNDLNVEGFMIALGQPSGVNVSYQHDPEKDQIIIEWFGEFSTDQCENIGQQLLDNGPDIIENNPIWLSGLQGFMQLIVLLYINQQYELKVRSYSWKNNFSRHQNNLAKVSSGFKDKVVTPL